MKKTLTLLFVAALIVPLVGQEAKIIIVEKPDSQRLKRAYEKFKEAQAEWNETKLAVAKQYTFEKGKAIEGWEKVQFSADFRAIVPESSQYATSGWGRNCWTTITNTGGSSGTFLSSSGTGTVTSDMSPNLVGDLGVDTGLTVKEKK